MRVGRYINWVLKRAKWSFPQNLKTLQSFACTVDVCYMHFCVSAFVVADVWRLNGKYFNILTICCGKIFRNLAFSQKLNKYGSMLFFDFVSPKTSLTPFLYHGTLLCPPLPILLQWDLNLTNLYIIPLYNEVLRIMNNICQLRQSYSKIMEQNFNKMNNDVMNIDITKSSS